MRGNRPRIIQGRGRAFVRGITTAHRALFVCRGTLGFPFMCGINGIFSFHADAPPIDVDELMRTREAMRMRGPDAAGVWVSPDRRIALGHRRLSVIDVSERANQPMVGREGDVVLTFNGEIY